MQKSSKCSFVVITVSDTRNSSTDKSGLLLKQYIVDSGHTLLDYEIVKDDMGLITSSVKKFLKIKPTAIILTGGTGVTKRDVTPEAINKLITKPLVGFGELFRSLSYLEIGPSTIQSRTTAGLINKVFVFALPGSPNACKTAWTKILQPQFDYKTKPCNLISMVGRL